MTKRKPMQIAPLDGVQCELVKGILMDVVAAIHAKNPADSSTDLVVQTHIERGDLLSLQRILKKL